MKETIRIIDYFNGEIFLQREVIDEKVIDIIKLELENEMKQISFLLNDEKLFWGRKATIEKYKNAIDYYEAIKAALDTGGYAEGLYIIRKMEDF